MSKLTPLLLGIFCFLASGLVKAQTGKEFWFVAPDVIDAHGESPVAFHITALSKSTKVTLSQPANPSFSHTIDLVANEHKTIEFSSWNGLADIENYPADQVNNKGILIRSEQDVAVYYEVAHSNNPDKFTLKGENALGTKFFISSQTSYYNYGIIDGYKKYANDPPVEQVNIVATEDGTTVEITPTADIQGHAANNSYTISLNRGQSYCIKGNSRVISYSLAGTLIESNKDIAVTISDDSVCENGWEHDLIGDQTIPVSVIGNEYIAIFSGDKKVDKSVAPINKVYILATEDNTIVTIDVNELTQGSFNLNKGEQIEHDIEEEGSLHIKSNQPIYVYQLSGLVFGGKYNELGSAILPPIKCTGSSTVTFTRNLDKNFYVQVLTQYENISSFDLKDNSGASNSGVDNLEWKRVPGTGLENADETWYFANKNLNGFISTGIPYRLSNSKGLFHLSIFDQNSTSASFGYYSAFNSLHIDGPTQECAGNEIELTASNNMDSYSWFSKATANTVLSTDRIYKTTESGLYWVIANRMLNATEGCELVDSIEVEFETPEFSLGSDVSICHDETYLVIPDVNTGTHEWYDGSTEQIYVFTASTDGKTQVWLEIMDADGCVGRDTIEITALPPVDIDIDLDVTVNNNVCYGHIIHNRTTLDAYEWRYNSLSSDVINMNSSIKVFNSGWYYLTATNDGCTSTDSVQVTVIPLPYINLTDDLLCHDGVYTSPISNNTYTYQWNTILSGLTSVTPQISLTQTDSLYVKVTDKATGCVNKDSAYIEFRPQQKAADVHVNMCAYTNQQLLADASIRGMYSWTFNGNALSEKSNILSLTNVLASQSGMYEVTGLDANGCTISQTFNLNVSLGDPIDLGGDKSFCENENITLSIGNQPANNFQWFYNENPEVNASAVVVSTVRNFTVQSQGQYYVKTQHSNGCYSVDSVRVSIDPLPTINLPLIAPACYGETEIYQAGAGYASYLWQDGSTESSYTATYPQQVSVSVVDVNGCKNTDVVNYEWKPVGIFADEEIVVCPAIDYTLTVSNSLSTISWFFDDGSGRVDLGVHSNSYTILNVDVANAGDYIVRANENGCMVEDTISLFVIDVASVNLGPNRTVCAGEILELNANLGFDSYEWRLASDPGTVVSTSVSINAGTETNANPEVWMLEVKENDNGCVLSDQISVEKMPVPNFDLQDNIEPCPGVLLVSDIINTLNSNSNIDGASEVKYYWGQDLVTSVNLADMIIEESGTFGIQVSNRYQDTNGEVYECYASDEVSVNFHDEFMMPQLSDQFICSGETVTLEAPAEVAAYPEFQSYQWHRLNPDQTIAESSSLNSHWVDASQQARYVLNVNYTGDACLASDTLVLLEKAAPVVQISGESDICKGDSVILSATAGYAGYTWNTGGVTDTLLVANTGVYDVKVIGHNGCESNPSFAVKVNELPVVSLVNSSISKCDDALAMIEIASVVYPDGSIVASPAYTWNTWANTSSLSVKKPGSYEIKVTDPLGCSGSADALVADFIKPDIDLSAIVNTACFSDGVNLICPLTVGTDIAEFQWTKSGSVNGNPALNTNWNVKESGTYILTVTDNNLCESKDSVEVSVLANPSVELGPDMNKCVGDSLVLKSPEQYESYQWSTGSTTSSIAVEASAIPVVYGINVWDSNGCAASDAVSVTSIPLPVVTITDPPIVCPGVQVELIPTIVTPSGNYSVWWSCNKAEEKISVGAGNYSIQVTDDVSGCRNSTSATVKWHPVPSVSLGMDEYLCPTTVDFPISPIEGDVFDGYKWHNNSSSYQINGDIGMLNSLLVRDANGCQAFDQVMIQYMITEDSLYQFAMCQQDTIVSLVEIDPLSARHTGEYFWLHDASDNEFNTFSSNDTVAVDIGITLDGTTTCYYKRDSLVFDFFPLPVIEILDTMIYSQIRVGVDLVNSPYSYSLDSVYWQDENVFKGLKSGTYTVCVKDNNECFSAKSVHISAEYDIEVPNFFTPNNDGYNDTWEIEGIDRMPDSKIRIYDRYGKLLAIYPATSPGWNGEYLNKPMPTNDYWYVVELIPVKKFLKGHFTLKR